MTAETDLLPDVKCWRAMKDRNGNVGYSDKPDPKYSESAGTDGLTWVRLDDHRAAMQAYARACVSSATEALRAEVQFLRSHRPIARRLTEVEARAERLAEALHHLIERCDDSDGAQYGTLGTSFVRDVCAAALHPTAAQEAGND